MGPFIGYCLAINYCLERFFFVCPEFSQRSRPRYIFQGYQLLSTTMKATMNLNHEILHADSSTCTLESGAHHPAHNVPQITGN